MTKEEYLKNVKMVQKMDFRDRVNDLNALKQAFGEQVVEIVLTERGKKVIRQWQQIASQHGRNDINGLKELSGRGLRMRALSLPALRRMKELNFMSRAAR